MRSLFICVPGLQVFSGCFSGIFLDGTTEVLAPSKLILISQRHLTVAHLKKNRTIHTERQTSDSPDLHSDE